MVKKVNFTQLGLNLCDPIDCSPLCSSVHGILQATGKNTGTRCHFLLQGIFSAQGLNLGLLYCRQIFYHLSHAWQTMLVKMLCNWKVYKYYLI